MVNVAVVGAGGFSSVHLQALANNPRARVRWIVDPDRARAEERARTFDIPNVGGDYREALDDPSVQAVDILTPNHFHCPIAVDAMEAAKDVICIKPMAPTPEECDRMIETSRKTHRRLIVSFHQRYDPVHQRVREMIASGQFERPVTIGMNFRTNDVEKVMTPGRWYGVTKQVGGGRLFSGGSHLIDILLSWMGPAKSVTAVTRRLVARYDDPKLEAENAESDDHAVCILENDRGTCATFDGSWASPIRVNEKVFYGAGEALRVVNEGNINRLERIGRDGRRTVLLEQEDWWRHCFQLAVDNHVAWLLGEAEPPYTLEETRHTMEVLFACYESSRTRRRIELLEKSS